MATAAWLLPLLALPSMAGLPALLQAPPPLPQSGLSTLRNGREAALQQGSQLRLNGHFVLKAALAGGRYLQLAAEPLELEGP